jgi:hypothetical protein
VAAIPKHKQVGQTTVLTKTTAGTTRRRLQRRSHPQMTFVHRAAFQSVQMTAKRNFPDIDVWACR